MAAVVALLFGNWRTTVAALAALILSQTVPSIVALFGTQPGLGWQIAAIVLGFLPGAFLQHAAPVPPPAAPAP